MEFYIWLDKGRVDEVSQALFAALARGCRVRILLDDFGSRAFLNSTRRKELVSAGAEICPAMPMKLWQIFGLQRADLRLHRKSIIIDERIAYTGSLNMIDPSAYADAKIVGDWIDAMVRWKALLWTVSVEYSRPIGCYNLHKNQCTHKNLSLA